MTDKTLATYEGQQEIAEAIRGINIEALTQKAVWVDSVADMRELDAPQGITVATRGYYEPNDGGNGFYYIRAKEVGAVDDGGSVIFLDNDNEAKLITDGTVNVKQFGAKGDNSTDDTTAFKNAIAVVPNEATVDAEFLTVYVPDGIYQITDTITINKFCNLIVDGTIAYAGTRDKPAFVIADINDCSFRFNRICDVSSQSNAYYSGWHGWSSDNYIAVDTQNLKNCDIEICHIIDFTVGFRALCNNAGKGYWQNRIRIRDVYNTKIGIMLTQSGSGAWINANRFEDMAFGYSSSTDGFTTADVQRYGVVQVFENGNTYRSNSNVFTNFHFELRSSFASNYTGMLIKYAYGWIIDKPRFEFNNNGHSKTIVIDCTNMTSADTAQSHSRRIIVQDVQFADLSFDSIIEFINLNKLFYNLSGIAEVVYDKPKYNILRFQEKDFMSSALFLGSSYYNNRICDFASGSSTASVTSLLQYRGYASGKMTDSGVQYTSSWPLAFYIPVTKLKTYTITANAGTTIRVKTYDSNGDFISTFNDTYQTGLASQNILYFNDTQKSILLSTTNKNELSFSIISDTIKYVAVTVYGTVNSLSVETDDGSAYAVTHTSDEAPFYGEFNAASAPTDTDSYSKAGTVVYKRTDITSYWRLEKPGGVLTWVAY